jgi:phosphatidylglycerol---prolipoprotein diacylglyceryl transferase
VFQFEIGMDPIIAQVGPFALRWYSLAIMLSIVIAVVYLRYEFKRRGIAMRDFDMFVFFAIAGGIIGARLFHVIDHPDRYLSDPMRILAFHQGGLAIYGGVIGGFITVFVLSRIYILPFRTVIDAITPGLVLAQAFGRLGCIINGDAWGAPTNSAFAFIYTHPGAMLPSRYLGIPTHPYPVYDLLMNLSIFGVLWYLRDKRLPPGALFATFITLYAFGRFFISFVREEQVWLWGLQEAQVISIVLFAAGIAAVVYLLRFGRDAAQTQPQPAGTIPETAP